MAETSVNNGVNVGALLAAREALKNAPEAAKFTWRASCKWQNGTHSLSKVEGFHGLGAEQKHKTEFSFEADHPEIFASEDLGATPVELVLVGLASCLTAGVAAQRVTDQDDVVTRRRQRPIGLVGDADRVQRTPAVERQRLRQVEELRLDSADRACGRFRR